MLRSDFFMVTYTATHGQSVLFLVTELASIRTDVLINSVGRSCMFLPCVFSWAPDNTHSEEILLGANIYIYASGQNNLSIHPQMEKRKLTAHTQTH